MQSPNYYKKNKILYLTPFPHIGGGETQLFYLFEKLNRKKFTPSVILPSSGQVSKHLEKMGISVFTIPFSPFFIRTFFVPGASPASFWRLFKFCRKFRPDIIHLNHSSLAIYGGLIGKFLKIPVAATFHGSWDSIYFYQDLATKIFINEILPITPEVERGLLKKHIIPQSKIKVIYFGIDTNKFKPAENKSEAKKGWKVNKDYLVVTMACRFDFTKDHLTFLKVAKNVIERFKAVKFIVAGDTQINLENDNDTAVQVKKQLDRYLFKNPQLLPHVIFTGFCQDMRKVYHATDILFSSSQAETLPVTFLEAAACGLPIISVIAEDSRQRIVIQGKNGFLAKPEEINLLTERLLTLLKNPKLRDEFGKFSRSLVGEKFTSQRYAQEIEQVYFGLINKKLDVNG